MTRSIAATVTAVAFAVGALSSALPAAASAPRHAATVVRVAPAAVRPSTATTYPDPLFRQVSTPARVYIGAPVTRLGVAANLSDAYLDFDVELVSNCEINALNRYLAGRLIFNDTPTKTLRTTLDVNEDHHDDRALGSFVFRIDPFNLENDQDVYVCTPTSVRRSSLLGLDATRTEDTVTVTAAARQYVFRPTEGYTAWAGRTVSIQRYSSSGWVTLRNVPTDSRGNLSVHLTIPFRTALRVRDADTATTWGAVSTTQIR